MRECLVGITVCSRALEKYLKKRNYHICHTQKSKEDLTHELGQQNIMVTSLDDSKPQEPHEFQIPAWAHF